MKPEDYRQLPENRHALGAGAILLATETPITFGGGTSKDFVSQQGGDEGTFIFILGIREARGPKNTRVEFVEGVFLSEEGPGFHPTWDWEQLLTEIDLGGWKVVSTKEMLAGWVPRVEERMNRGEP